MPEYAPNGVQIVNALAFDPTRKHVLSLGNDGKIYWVNRFDDPDLTTEMLVWDPETGLLTFQGQSGTNVNIRIPRYTTATLPAAGIPGRIVYTTDDNKFRIDTGSAWSVAPVGVPISVADGGTGATTAAGARANLGLRNAARIDHGKVIMARQPTGTWEVFRPDGTTVNLSTTRTDGLQEAINEAVEGGWDLEVTGGGAVSLGSGALGTNPFSTTAGSTTVTVNHPNHGFTETGTQVMFAGSTSVNGIPAAEINGIPHPITIVNANTYTFTVTTPATSTGSGGGSSVTWVAGIDRSVISCLNPVVFPPMFNKSIRLGAVTLNLMSSPNPGLIFDSCMMVNFELHGQVVYGGISGTAVLFQPSNPVPLVGNVAIVDSHFYIKTVTSKAPDGGCRITPGNGSIAGNRFEFREVNATPVGILLAGHTTHAITLNTIVVEHLHATTGIGLGVGTATTDQVFANDITAFLSPANGAGPAVQVFGKNNRLVLAIHDGEGVAGEGIKLESSASGNEFTVLRNTATVPVNDQSTLKNNRGLPGSGVVRCSVHRNGTNQSVPNSTWTKVLFTHEQYDDGGAFSTATSRWTPGRIGRARIAARVSWANMPDAVAIGIAIYRGGGPLHEAHLLTHTNSGAHGVDIATDVAVLYPTDYFEILVYQGSGASQAINGSPSMTWMTAEMLE